MNHTRSKNFQDTRWTLRGPSALLCFLLAVLCLLPAEAAQPTASVSTIPVSLTAVRITAELGRVMSHHLPRNDAQSLREFVSAPTDETPEDICARIGGLVVPTDSEPAGTPCAESVMMPFFLPKRVIGSSE